MTIYKNRFKQIFVLFTAFLFFLFQLLKTLSIIILQSFRGDISGVNRLINNLNNLLDLIQSRYSKKLFLVDHLSNSQTIFINCLAKASELYQESSVDDAVSMFKQAHMLALDATNSLDMDNVNFSLIGSAFTESIGHMAMPFSVRVKMNKIFPNNKKYLVLYSKSANSHYLGLWRKYFSLIKIHPGVENVIENQFWPFYDQVSYFQSFNKFYGLDEAHDIATRIWEKQGNEPLLALDEEAKDKGYRYLIENGFKVSDGWFVTLHVRNSYVSLNGKNVTHLYGRNAQFRDYELAISHIIKNGGFVVRIGEDDGHYIKNREGFLDYTKSKIKNSVLDTFFLAECKFMIGTNSGPICVPETFGKPTLMTNTPGAVAPYFPKSIIIPKLITDQSGRIINLNEALKSQNGWTHQILKNYSNKKMFWRDNDPSEILDATIEMMNGIDQKLSINQLKYEKVLRSNGVKATSVISNSFISKHSKDIL
jgi:putative glycosyltransferase (TIGR04372 family)